MATGMAPLRRWRRVPRADRWAVAGLGGLPFLLYVPFSLAGHPLMPGDNLVQNYPLRLLAGEILRSGRLPAWDPMIWSGTPLLAGWNGGSMFPGTWLFAVLPGIAAWTVNYAATPAVASIGAYVLLRRLSCGGFGSVFGALAFTYTGFLSGQLVHLGLEQGTALLPWTLVALEVLSRRATARSDGTGSAPGRLAWPVGMLAVTSALTVLAGDPRAVTTSAIVDLVYLIALFVRRPRDGRDLLGGAFVGVVLGALASAIQWLPGIRFVQSSQRGNAAYGFFGSGSVGLPHLASLVLVPFLSGGNGNLGMPVYAGPYNLPELTIGAGTLASVAFMAYLPELGRSLRGWLSKRSGWAGRGTGGRGTGGRDEPGEQVRGRRPLGVWYVLGVVGVVLTLGTNTPLGHVLVHIPLLGGERLQNRNAAIFDVSLCVLVAFLLDDLAKGRQAGAVLGSRMSRLLGLVPVVATGAVIGIAYASPISFEKRIGIVVPTRGLFDAMTIDLAWELAVAGAVAVVVVWPGRWTRRNVGRAVLAVVAMADIGLYVVNESFAGAPASVVGGPGPVSRAVERFMGGQGRYALYNPLLENPSTDPEALNELGVTDLNIAQGNPSVQGYGSIVASRYENATDTHEYENLAQGRLGGGTFDVLDLRALVTLPAYFQEAVPPQGPIPVRGTGRAPKEGAPSPPPGTTGPFVVRAGERATFVLARPEELVRIDVVVNAQLDGRPRTLRIGVEDATGTGRTARSVGTRAVVVPVVGGHARLGLVGLRRGDEITIENPTKTSAVLGAVVVVVAHPDERLVLNGVLQAILTPPHWRYGGSIGRFVIYENERTAGLAWLQRPGSTIPDPTETVAGRISNELDSPTAGEEMRVDAPRPVLLVRSETYSPGWTARVVPTRGGPVRVIEVRQLGLVQAVRLPPGRYEVTWRYAPVSILVGLLGSVLGTCGIVFLAFIARRSRRSRPSGTAVNRDDA